MTQKNWPILVGGALLAYALYASLQATPTPAPTTQPAPKVAPKEPDKPKRRPAPCPNCPMRVREQSPSPNSKAPQLGGIFAPDGSCRTIFLPDDLHWPKNIPSRGLGCCGFRSVDYAARIQGVSELVDWPEQMRDDGVPGGAYPEKIDSMLKRYAPGVTYWNDTTGSLELIQAAVRSQRMPCVDYSGRDPHYRGGIAHCVNVVACDLEADWIAILDNNYPALDEIVWMSVAEFRKRWGGWCYGLLACTPGAALPGTCHHYCETFDVVDGVTNYGLDLKQGPFGNDTILNGKPSTTADAILAIGPEMAPVKIEVDHEIKAPKMELSPLNIALGGGAVLLFYLISQQKKEQK